MKVDYFQFKNKLEASGKTFFSFHDLRRFYPHKEESLKVLLSGWVKRDLVFSLTKGYYAFSAAKVDYLRLANHLDNNSYISFEYALYYHNFIDQVPATVTSATHGRPRTITVLNWGFEYTHLKEDLFFGYDLIDKIYIAAPEKALADLIYLMAKGKRSADLSTLEKNRLNMRDLVKILKKFPGYTTTKAKELGVVK